MNAYELANELEAFYVDIYGFPYKIKEAMNMLRQQADYIAELEKSKTLTDEEIEDLIDSEIPMILLGGRLFYCQFARAILRKAQEK